MRRRLLPLLLVLVAAPAFADPGRIEPTVLPGTGFDSNVGVAFGLTADISRTAPGARLHDWRIYSFLYGSVRVRQRAELSRVVLHAQGDIPGLAGGRLRLLPRLFVRWFRSVGYYGIGNAAVRTEPWRGIDEDEDPDRWAAARGMQEYERRRGFGRLDLRWTLRPGLDLFGGAGVTFARTTAYDGSVLAADLAGASGSAVAAWLASVTAPHAQLDGQLGLVLDRRDEETDTRRGYWHEFSLRGAAALPDRSAAPAGWGALNTTLRWYAPFADGMFTIATRLVADVMVGRPPLYELTSTGGSTPGEAFGGQTGMRGLPTWRYHGRVKVFGTAELRARLLEFRLLKRRAMIGGVLFVDAGRVWSGLRPDPALDGPGPGLHATPGAGLRVRWGETFLLRVDAALGDGTWQLYADVGSVF